MYHFKHPNVLTLSGVCLDAGPAPYIIMPFMAKGSVLAYLKKNKATLNVSRDSNDDGEVQCHSNTVESRDYAPPPLCMLGLGKSGEGA